MAARIGYDVSYRTEDEKWQVKKHGNDRASSLHDTKAQAIEAGRELAKNHQPSQLFVHTMDGQYQKEYTYGDDPYPPSG